MRKELVMAVDLGTSLIKTAVYDLEGRQLAQSREFVHSEQPEPGVFEQRGEEIYAATLGCIRQTADQLGERAAAIAAIAFTGQMAGFMGVGDDWEDVTGWSCSIDTRYTPFAQAQTARFSEDFMRISGTNSPLFCAKHAWFSAAFPERAKRIRKYVMLNGYILGRLGNLPVEEAVIDGSLLTWTGLADVKKRAWSERLCDGLGVTQALLPRIVPSWELVGALSLEAAKAIHLPSGIPLVAGAGDKIAGCVGAGNLRPGAMLFEAASFGAVSCTVTDFRPDMQRGGFDILNGAEDGTLYAHYYMPGSGITQEWFVRQFAQERQESLEAAYRRMDEALTDVPAGCDGLMAIGMLGGTVMPFDGDIRGVFLGHTWSHGRAHFYRALMESFGFALASAIDRIDDMYPEYANREEIRVIGGGVKSENCMQLFADTLGKPLEIIGQDDAALWGACILAAKSVGLIDSINQFTHDHVTRSRVYQPNDALRDLYQRFREQYQNYEKKLSPLCGARIR